MLADYGSTVESEIEVFGLIGRANDDPAGFSLLAMVLGLFETGYLYGAAKGFFEYNRGHLSRDADRMGVRLGDAMYRGAKLAWHLDDTGRSNETDLLATDWFQHADRQLDELRAEFGLLEKSARLATRARCRRSSPAGSRHSSTRTGSASPKPSTDRTTATARPRPDRDSLPRGFRSAQVEGQ